MASEMVDQVAQALLEARKNSDAVFDPFELARAAILSMRTPTDAMLAAATYMPERTEGEDDANTVTWECMIDAALVDQEGGA